MALSRRALLYTSMLTAAGATLSWPLTRATGATADLGEMTSDTFLPYVTTRFRLFSAGQQVATVTLVEVELFTPPADGTMETASQDAFSLIFRGSRTVQLPQNVYKVRHGVLGTFPLLLVPIGRSRVHYEAVFNRLRG